MEASSTLIIPEAAVMAKNPPPPFDCREIILDILTQVLRTDEENLSLAI
jgi:hypothetical protein